MPLLLGKREREREGISTLKCSFVLILDGPTTPEIVTESFDLNEVRGELEDELVDADYDESNRQLMNAALAKRLTRNERSDNRRYHTAGAIEDIKVRCYYRDDLV